MDKEARLSSARKRLKDFRRKREVKASSTKANDSDSSEKSIPQSNNDKPVIKHSPQEIVVDGSSSTAVNTESILQVSSSLTGLLAEVESLTENGTSNGNNGEPLEINSSGNASMHVDNTVKDLQRRNVELSERLGIVEVEREQLFAQCQNLSEQLQMTAAKSSQLDDVHERFETQKQTIEILVSEKQGLQRELSDLKSKAESSSAEQLMLQEAVQKYKKQIDSYESELQAKMETISVMEATLEPLRADHSSNNEEISKLRQALEREKLQTTELGMKLSMKETECNNLFSIHADMQEKLNMAEVLLQQYSVRTEGTSNVAQLEQEIRRLSQELVNSQQALEKLADERSHLNKQHADAQVDWESHVQRLETEIQTLKESLSEQSSKIMESAPEETPTTNSTDDQKEIVAEICTVDSCCQTENFFEEKISALLNDNEHLSRLMQEKEIRIHELENEVHDAKGSLQDHENLLESARNDKVTISRALTQNKQLKEQLEEIQNSFISVSNDKMDLATELSSLESVNKSLSGRLQEITNAFNMVKQELDGQKLKMQEITSNYEMKAAKESSYGKKEVTSNDGEPVAKSVAEPQPDSEPSTAVTPIENNSIDYDPDTVIPPAVEDKVPVRPLSGVGNGDPAVEDRELVRPLSGIANGDPAVKDRELVRHLSGIANGDPAVEDGEPVRPLSGIAIGDPKMMEKLQEKFTAVMQERADLMNRVEMLEHANTQLQNECDTIGEYITLYHNQRQLLKQRHQEKDEYISSIIQEREEMRGKVEQLQTLVGTVLRPSRSSIQSKVLHISDKKEMHSSKESLNSDSVGSDMLPQPDLVPRTDVSVTEANVVDVPYSSLDETSEVQDEVNDAAAQQILNLLKQMQKPIEQSPSNSSRPTGFCMHYIGPYTAI